jgi:hypothetical protein
MKTITGYKGDLIQEIKQGKHDIIVHCVDCSNHWEERDSLSAELDKIFNLRLLTPRGFFTQNNYDLLGHVTFSETFVGHLDKIIKIVTCFTSLNQKSNNSEHRINYTALALCLQKVAYHYKGQTVTMGALASNGQKADKTKVQQIIKEYLQPYCNIKIVIQ